MKLPYFNFYPADFVMGTMTMSCAEKGAYISLLCHQWAVGHVPDSPKQLAAIANCRQAIAKKVFDNKFCMGADGLWRNLRMEQERQIAENGYAKKRDSGQKAANARWHPQCERIPIAVRTQCQSESESERQERERAVEFPHGFPKTETEAAAGIGPIGCPAEFAAATWLKACGRGGRDAKDVPIRQWAGYLATEWKWERQRIEQQKKVGQPASGAGTAEKIIRQKEFDRGCERMRVIRSQYEAFQAWSEADKAEWEKLKKRKGVLKEILGLTI